MSDLKRDKQLISFLRESNKIERIKNLNVSQIDAAKEFIELSSLTLPDLVKLVSVFQPDALLRDKENLDVFVGKHKAPTGGVVLLNELDNLLHRINTRSIAPFNAHCCYLYLHPFTDCNGRSARLIWLWQMLRIGIDTHGNKRNACRNIPSIGFLQSYYYQSLEYSDDNIYQIYHK